ncbi:MAG: short-chain dehydrogenase/reductase [Variovorax sp.]|nr:short-chain dehydrogenase/reductase [Variovorax sp.]
MHEASTNPSGSPLSARARPSRAGCVVLTGASSGIGRAAALAFSGEGADLVLASRNRSALEAVALECEAAGGSAVVIQTDVTDPKAMQALARAAIEHFGAIDVWINNVGVGAVGLFEDTPIEAHRRIVEANLLGHMHGAHVVLPHFKERGHGTLINMISIGGWIAAPYAAAYSASKFGLRGFSEALRAELSGHRDIHVCEVFPTFVDTPGMSHGANFSGHKLRPPPPVLDPRRVADALVSLSKRPRARTSIGAPARPGILAHGLAPELLGRTMKWGLQFALARAEPAAPTNGNLFEASHGLAIDGGFRQKGASSAAVAIGLAAAALGVVALSRRRAGRGASS